MTELALFPLGTVLLPGQLLRLRIFEPRYRRLLADLVSGPADARVFGVVAIRAGHEVGVGNARELYAVGCLARLVSVSTTSADGVAGVAALQGSAVPISISARGGARFRIVGLVPEPDAPYLVGRVDWLPDDPTDLPPEATARARAAGTAYRRATGLGGTPDPARVERPDELVATLADDLNCPLARRQELLEAPLGRRLELVAAWAERETALTHALGTRPGPVGPGGYNPN